MKRHATAIGFAPLACALALGGCGTGVPQGQVIATIDGDDITQRDLAAEYEASGLPADAEGAVRDTLVRRIVDRRLLVREAERRGIDRTPDYLAKLRRQREVLMASTLAIGLAARVPKPTPAMVADYVARHRWRFAGRQIVTIDGIAVDLPPLEAIRLAALPSLGAIADRLRAAGRPFTRRITTLDSATLSRVAAARITDGQTGTPIMPGDDKAPTFAAVTARIAAPVDAATARDIATATLRQARSAAVIQRQIEAARGRTAIRYQVGFGPSAAAARR